MKKRHQIGLGKRLPPTLHLLPPNPSHRLRVDGGPTPSSEREHAMNIVGSNRCFGLDGPGGIRGDLVPPLTALRRGSLAHFLNTHL